MLRFLSRMIGFWLIAGALVAAVVDGAKSLAASALVTTPLFETWAAAAALLEIEGGVPQLADAPWPMDLVLTAIFSLPTAIFLAGLGFLFLLAGRKRRRNALGREFPA
jgi:hypothetical protein